MTRPIHADAQPVLNDVATARGGPLADTSVTADTPAFGCWQAALELRYARRGERTALVARRQQGPLTLQKSLYPEGDHVCHNILLHPPGGIAGGDSLVIDARLDRGSHALITTPGAAKWYRSAGRWASQRVHLQIAAGALLEWLPQETIAFDGARADSSVDIQLEPGGRLFYWDIVCLGRPASHEQFASGEWRQRLSISHGDKPLFVEQARIEGGSCILASPVGMAGQPVMASIFVTLDTLDANRIDRLRSIPVVASAQAGVTVIDQLLVARYLGPSTEGARHYGQQVWEILRPDLAGQPAQPPRIWRT